MLCRVIIRLMIVFRQTIPLLSLLIFSRPICGSFRVDPLSIAITREKDQSFSVDDVERICGQSSGIGYDPGVLLNDAMSIEGSLDIYWIPVEKFSLRSEFVKDHLIPSICSPDKRYHRFFVPALLANYLIPSWLGSIKLHTSSLEIFSLLAPLLSPFMRQYFQLVIWAVYFETAELKRDSSALMIRLNKFVEGFGFKLRDLALQAMNKRHYDKIAITAPHYNILAVAKQLGLNVQKIAKRMPDNIHSKEIQKNPNYIPAVEVSALSVLQNMSPLGKSLKRASVEIKSPEPERKQTPRQKAIEKRREKRAVEQQCIRQSNLKRKASNTEASIPKKARLIQPSDKTTTVSVNDLTLFMFFVNRVQIDHALKQIYMAQLLAAPSMQSFLQPPQYIPFSKF